MKKLLALCLTVVLCLCYLASCDSAHKENTWFSEEKLTNCLVGDLPTIEKDYVNHNGEDIYVSFTSKEREAYVSEVFEYLKSQNFKYLGTRGKQASTLAGSFTTYYFKPAIELSEFYVASSYKFVYSDGTLDEDGDLVFCIINIYDYEAKNLEYGTKNFEYNTLITLDYKSEAPLSGFYVLNEEMCADHIDDDEDGICDACSFEYVFIYKLKYDESGYELDRVGPGYKGGDIVIPSEYKGLPVIEIGYSAFTSDYKLTSVVIPDTVTLIDSDAFEKQTSLASVYVGKGVVTIGVSAFEGCTSLKTVVISDATEFIYAGAFRDCTSLETVTLGKNVKEITGYVFRGCTSLKTITIPASIVEMGAWVFEDTNMTDVYFGVSAPGENWHEEWADGLEGVNLHWYEAKECDHQWDEGVEIEGGSGGYVMEYTCLLCGSKEREIITIIPPEN